MLVKLYKIGAVKLAVTRPYVLSGLGDMPLVESVRLSDSRFSLIKDKKNPSLVKLQTPMSWLGNAQERSIFFVEFANAQTELVNGVRALGGKIYPGVVSNVWPGVNEASCTEAFRFLLDDEVEQAYFCQVLREAVPALIVGFGRASLTNSGIDPVHSSRILNGAIASARHWPSTSPEHLKRVATLLRSCHGIGSLASLEIYPGFSADGTPFVEIAVLDSQYWLTDTRAAVVVLLALFLKARRMAREGTKVNWSHQDAFERDRLLAAAEGPKATLGPFRQSGGRVWLELILGLRREIRVLEVDYAEFEGQVLGSVLKVLGKAAVQNENDALRVRQRISLGSGANLSETIAEFLDRPLDNPVRDINKDRFSEMADHLGVWWQRWLSGDPNLGDLLPKRAENVSNRQRQVQAKPQRQLERLSPTNRIEGGEKQRTPPEKGAADTSRSGSIAAFAAAWCLLPHGGSVSQKIQVLLSFRSLYKDLGRLIATIDQNERTRIRNELRTMPIMKFVLRQHDDVRISGAVRQAIASANNEGLSVVVVEMSDSPSRVIENRAFEVRSCLPSEIVAFSTLRIVEGRLTWQELLLVSTNWRAS